MSVPDPISTYAPSAYPAPPRSSTEPISAVSQPSGRPGPDNGVRRTFLNSAPVHRPRLCEQTANPMQARSDMGMAMAPTHFQAIPSAEANPVNRSPVRASRTQYGARSSRLPVRFSIVSPVSGRYWKAVPLAALRVISACLEESSTDSRIITPALAHSWVFRIETTCATISASPLKRWKAKWKASSLSHLRPVGAGGCKAPAG